MPLQEIFTESKLGSSILQGVKLNLNTKLFSFVGFAQTEEIKWILKHGKIHASPSLTRLTLSYAKYPSKGSQEKNFKYILDLHTKLCSYQTRNLKSMQNFCSLCCGFNLNFSWIPLSHGPFYHFAGVQVLRKRESSCMSLPLKTCQSILFIDYRAYN